LAPENEVGVIKFICTTLRPTKLPYEQLYTWEGCSKFIADFLEYEELDPPHKLPYKIPSPANILEWQAGDSFDFSMVLCSLLIGCGYDAYVVYGKGPRYITTRDESLMECPEFQMPVFPTSEEEEITPPVQEVKRTINPDELKHQMEARVFSEFDREMEEKKQADAKTLFIEENVIDDDEPEYEKYDPWENLRLHCWVLLKKGKRQLNDTFFIEPTTGRKYNPNNSPYLSVEAIFNNKNFWINMEPTKRVHDVNFEEFETIDNNPNEWEYVMLTPLEKQSSEKEGEDDLPVGGNESESEEEEKTQEEDILDLPPSWSPKLRIDRDAFDKLCPLGEKTIFYVKSKVDMYADYKQPDGLVLRVTYYKDYKRHIIEEIRSFYRHRRDKLVLKRRFPFEFKTIEEYAPGKMLERGREKKDSHLRKLIHIDATKREMYYYPHRNEDGLIYREEQIGRKTIEKYRGHKNKLLYRSVTFESNSIIPPISIHILERKSENRDWTLEDNHCGEVTQKNQKTQKTKKTKKKP
jgi:hypothetical protein